MLLPRAIGLGTAAFVGALMIQGLACSGDEGDNGTPPPAPNDAATDQSIEELDFYGGGCPSKLPTEGASCSTDNRICSYGRAPRGECRPRATCKAGQWTLAQPGAACQTSSQCPKDIPTGSCGGSEGRLCAYADGVECSCSGADWVCTKPKDDKPEGCPVLPPNAGTECSDSQECAYPCGPLSASSVTMTCGESNVWDWTLMACPNKP